MNKIITVLIFIFQISCTINVLKNKELCDYFPISQNAMYLITCYKFTNSSYSIYMIEHYGGSPPYPKHLVEEGKYVIKKNKVQLTPKIKLLTKIINTDYYVPSRKFKTFDSVALVLKDTLTLAKINDLQFTARTCTITKVNEAIYLCDPQIQILRYTESPYRNK